MAQFLHNKLNVTEQDLQELQWYELIEKLIDLHNRGVCRLVPSPVLTVHEVAMRIMRKENYLIGLINQNRLDISVPWWMSSFMSERLFLTRSLEWSLNFCVLDHMFATDQLEQEDMPDISQDFLTNVEGLKWRLQVVGLIHVVLLPFMLAFMTVHFFLQNAQQFHSSKAYLGPRQWSPLALWQFREFNELPHLFEERLTRSYAPTNEYLTSSFRNPYIAIIARFVAYIAGAFVAALLLVSLVSEGVLLYVQYGEHNLLWYLGIFTAIFAGARAFVPEDVKSARSPDELLEEVGAHTHYFPSSWTGKAKSVMVREELAELFQYKAQIFLMEVLSVVLTPAVLCFSLPSSASLVVNFIRDHSRFVQGIGAVCDYSLFDFDAYGDEKFASDAPVGQQSVHHPGVGASVMQQSQFRAEKPVGGKLEKSFLNFRQAHPNFEGNAAAMSMCKRLDAFKEMHYQQREEELLSSAVGQSMLLSVASHAYQQPHQQFRGGFVPGRFGQPMDKTESSEDGLSEQQRSHSEIMHSSGGSLPSSPVVSKSTLLGGSHENVMRAGSMDEDNIISPFAQSAVPDTMTSSSNAGMFQASVTSNVNGFPTLPMPQMRAMVSDDSIVCDPDDKGLPLESAHHSNIEMTYRPGNNPRNPHGPRGVENSGECRPLSLMSPVATRSGLYPRRGRSLLNDSAASTAHMSSRFSNNSRADLRLLMSVLKAENIDFENDYYWMNKFHHDKVNHPQQLEKSLLQHSQRKMQQQEDYSPVLRSYGGTMQDIYGTESASGIFIGSNSFGDIHAAAAADPAFAYGVPPHQQHFYKSNDAGSFSPPRSSHNLAGHHTSHLHSPVVSRNVVPGNPASNIGGNRLTGRHASQPARKVYSSPGLTQLPETDQEE